jgi:hypothetical protein
VLKTILIAIGALTAATHMGGFPQGHRTAGFDAEEVLARIYAAYAALNSYADSGTVVDESNGFRDRITFRTLQTRQPRNFLLDFRYAGSEYDNGFKIDGGERTMIWMQNGELQTWNSKTEEHATYPEDGGRQVDALTGAANATRGVSVLVPSLIYIKAKMASVLRATEEVVAAGTETIGGRSCFKVMGVERWRYPNGRITGVRPVTVWIDSETYLIRRLLEDTPKDSQRGSISRRVFTFEPQANPPIETGQFQYAVPES